MGKVMYEPKLSESNEELLARLKARNAKAERQSYLKLAFSFVALSLVFLIQSAVCFMLWQGFVWASLITTPASFTSSMLIVTAIQFVNGLLRGTKS
jgi:hypothetical protein